MSPGTAAPTPSNSAVIGSTFVRQDGPWKLALHEQTPTDGPVDR
jgi:hypothetical protein